MQKYEFILRYARILGKNSLTCTVEYGLKAQKHIAQGNALGFNVVAIKRPERAKALCSAAITLLPFQGAHVSSAYKPRVLLRFALGYVLVALSGRSCILGIQTQGVASLCPGLCARCPFRAFLIIIHLDNIQPYISIIFNHTSR